MIEQPSKGGASRRGFLKQSTAAMAGVAGATLTGSLASRTYAAGSDEIRFALIGCGGRGSGAANQALSSPGPIKMVAMADVFASQLEGSLKNLKAEHADKITVDEGTKFVGFDAYKQAMAVDGLNAVILATPPGFRPLHFAHAVDSGKHVFMEKPIATDPAGCRKVLEYGQKAAAKGLRVGVGLQRHHQDTYLETMKRIHGGQIGDITSMRVYWNAAGVWVRGRDALIARKLKEAGLVTEDIANDPVKLAALVAANRNIATEMEYQMDNWYYFNWICGDHIVEQHIHNIDVGLWAKGKLPIYAIGCGGREVRKGADHGQIFDHHNVEYYFDDGCVMHSQCRHQPNTWGSVTEHAHGTRGYSNMSGASIEPYDKAADKWRFRGRSPNPYQVEHDDLWAAVRANEAYNEVERGAHATFAAILGRLSSYSGNLVRWDTAWKSEIVLAPGIENFTWDTPAPVMPDANGKYPVPVPGETEVV